VSAGTALSFQCINLVSSNLTFTSNIKLTPIIVIFLAPINTPEDDNLSEKVHEPVINSPKNLYRSHPGIRDDEEI
jgi:hypothetical protein